MGGVWANRKTDIRFRYKKMLLCSLLVVLLLVAVPASAFAAGNILFWSTKTAPPDTFLSGYGGTWLGNLFCFGGVRTASSQAALTDVYLYNPAGQTGGTWYTFPSSSPPSVDPAYATTGGGFVQFGSKVYVFGGKTNTGLQPTNIIWSYDMASGITTYEGTMNAVRGGSGVAVVGNYAYVVGGQAASTQMNSIEVVDLMATPGTLTGVPMTGFTLTDAVTRPIVFADATSLYIFGGLMSSLPTPSGTCSNQALRLLPGANPPSSASWMTPPTAMPYGRQGHHQKAMSGGSVFVTGGAINNDVMEYDMALDQWGLIGTQPQAIGRSLNILNASGTEVFEINGLDKITNTLYQVTQAGQIVPATAVGTPVTIPGANTPVTANAGGTNITASFDNVTNPGSAQLNVSVLPVTSLPPGAGIGFRIQGQVYDIATTADGYGNVIVTLPYTGNRVPVVRHWTGSAWVPITFEWPTSTYPTSPYAIDPWTSTGGGYPAHVQSNGKILSYGSGTVTFQTPSLSPFALEEAPEEQSTPASSTWSLLLAAVGAAIVMGSIGFSRKRLAR